MAGKHMRVLCNLGSLPSTIGESYAYIVYQMFRLYDDCCRRNGV